MDRVLVVGAGIAGAAVALTLRRRGLGVVVLERRTPDDHSPDRTATAASAGMLALQYEAEGDDPLFRMALASRRRHPEFLARLESLTHSDLGLQVEGMLVPSFTPDEEAAASASVAWQRAAGLEAQIVDGREASRLQPGVTAKARSWTWLPDEARLDTQRLAAILPAALEAAGCEVRSEAPASGVSIRADRVTGVALEGGEELAAGRVVVAAGAWSGRLAGLPRPLPVRPVRGQMVRFAPSDAPSLRRLVAGHGGCYLVPRPDGGVLAGSTMEDAGFEAGVTEDGLRRITRGAERLVPAAARSRIERRWSGFRPISADGAPILGADPELQGLFYATGYGRNGILLAPEGAEVVTAQIAGDRPSTGPGPFGIGRFGDPDGADRGGDARPSR